MNPGKSVVEKPKPKPKRPPPNPIFRSGTKQHPSKQSSIFYT